MDPVEPETAPESDFLVPEGLALTDEELTAPVGQTLRVSVPTLVLAAPQDVVETNAAQVLLTDLLTDGLTRINPISGLAEPAIADSYEVSEDGLLWTFTLGTARFTDGTIIRADDVVASLNKVAEQGTASISGPGLWPIVGWTNAGGQGDGAAVSGIRAIDTQTVEFTLSQPFAPLDEVLSGVSFGILPANASGFGAVVGELPVGSATDYVPTEVWVDGLRLEGQGVDTGITSIELIVDPDLTMLRAGETDLATSFDTSQPLDGLTGVPVQQSATSYFAMNASIAPFDDPMIRQAIVHAIDTEQLRSEFFPNDGIMRSLVAQQVAGGVPDACGDNCSFDPEEAALLVEASPNSDVAFDVDYIDRGDGGADRQLAEAVVAMLNEVGLNAQAQPRTPEGFPVRLANSELGMFRFGSVSTAMSPESVIGMSFHSLGLDNVTNTSIERVDALIDEARRTEDATARADLYSNAEMALLAEAAVAPLVEFRHQLAFGDALTEAGLEPDGSLNLAQIQFADTEALPVDGE